MLTLHALFLTRVFSLHPYFSASVDALTKSSMLVRSTLDKYSLSISYLGCKALYIIMGFLLHLSISSSSSHVHFKNCPEHLTRTRRLSHCWDFCYIVCIREVSSFSWDKHLNFFLSSPLVWWCPLPVFPNIFRFPFLRAF